MASYSGAAVIGPAGTGKSSTIRELANALGVFSPVLNCAPHTSYSAISSLISGSILSGHLLCLDEVDHLSLPILSTLSNHINALFHALAAHAPSVTIDGSSLPLHRSASLAVTMDPPYAT